MIRRLMFFLAGALFALAPACASTNEEEVEEGLWREAEVNAPSDRVLWQLTLLSLQNLGYPLSSGLDPSSGIVTSGWKTDLQPFSGEGMRTRASVRIAPIEPGRWKVRTRVEKELNKAMASPLDATRAEWKPAPDDERTAGIILMHIRSRLDPKLEIAPAGAGAESLR